MQIIVGDTNCLVQDIRLLPTIREICRARPDGFQFMKRYKSGVWDGYISLMSSFKSFPTGLLDIVLKGLEAKNFTVTVEDTRKFSTPRLITSSSLCGIELRDYQIEAIDTLLKHRTGVAKMATNSGKTEVMAGIVWALNFPNTVVLVHTKELLYQTAERFQKRLNTQIGIIGDGIYKQSRITVSMIQTLSNKFKKREWQDNTLVMGDEIHHMSSDQMMNIAMKIPGSYRFGFSGTPLKYDTLSDMKLVAATGDIRYDVSNRFLIEGGYSAMPTVHMHTIVSDHDKYWDSDYQEAYEKLIVLNGRRNRKIAEIAKSCTGITLILVNRIDHGKILNDLIKGSVMVNGSDSTEFRREILDRMRTDDQGIFISTPILDEGVDVPGMNTLILAGGGRSHVKLLQRIGRGMRKKSGDNVLEIHDFIDDTNQYLFEHSGERIDIYASEGFRKVLDD